MQAVGQAPGAIEGDEERGDHRQRGWQPYGNFTVTEQLVEYSHNHVVERRQGVCAVAERCQKSSPIRQARHVNGNDFVEPEETMGRDIDAGGEIERGQHRGDKEAPCAGMPPRRLSFEGLCPARLPCLRSASGQRI